MEKRETFLASWRKEYGSQEPPESSFLESDDEKLFLERLKCCKQRIQESVSVLRREGFLLKWLSDTLNVDIWTDEENALLFTEVMQVLFDHSSIKTDELHSVEKSIETLPFPAVLDKELEVPKELFNNKNSKELDSSNSTVNRSETRSGEKESSECGVETSGSQTAGNVRLNENNPAGAAVEIQFELFNKTNIESWNKGGSRVHIEKRDTNVSVTSDKGLASTSREEEIEDRDACFESLESSSESSIASVEDMAKNFGAPLTAEANKESPASLEDLCEARSFTDQPFSAICAPFAAGIIQKEGKRSKHKWHVPYISHKHDRGKHERSQTHDGVFDVARGKSQNAKKEGELNDCATQGFNKYLNDGSGTHNIVLTTSAKNSIEEGKDRVAVVNEPVNITLRIDSASPTNDLENNTRVFSSETHTSEDTVDTPEECEESTPDTPDAIEVIGDLMSYLDTVEVISSDEDTSQDIITLTGLRAASRTRTKLSSAISSMSVQSGDSCMSPWAIDVASAELGDSTDGEDTPAADSLPPGKSEESLSSLADAICAEFDNEPLPIRPPRRNKSDRRSLRTVAFEAKKSHIGDDEVFKPVDDGYEGKLRILQV